MMFVFMFGSVVQCFWERGVIKSPIKVFSVCKKEIVRKGGWKNFLSGVLYYRVNCEIAVDLMYGLLKEKEEE